MIPDAPVLIVTLSPITTLEFVIVTIPVVIVLLSPSMVTDARPTVKSPTILALPSTYSAVFPTPPIVVVPDVPTIVAIPLVIFRPLLSI